MKTRSLRWLGLIALLAGLASAHAAVAPKPGDAAPHFTLSTLDGRALELKKLNAEKPVLLVVLRGWPGYQCPLCTRQVHDLMEHAADFAALGVQVLMVYPGPADALHAHAQAFLQNKDWPTDFLFVVDPNYEFTNAYGLRWDAKGETAYPSSFLIEKGGRVSFAKVSRGHGDRLDAATALAALKAMKR